MSKAELQNLIRPVEDFIREHHIKVPVNDYIRGHVRPWSVVTGFLPWSPAEAFRWSGPWADRFVLLSVDDLRLRSQPLLTGAALKESFRRYLNSSIYQFPFRLRDRFDRRLIINGTKCQRSDMTSGEITELLSLVTAEEIAERDQNIAAKLTNYEKEMVADATAERPVRVHLIGTDDCSYGFTYETPEHAYRALVDLALDPTFDALEKAGFVFTN